MRVKYWLFCISVAVVVSPAIARAEYSGAEDFNEYRKQQRTTQLEGLYTKARNIALDLEKQVHELQEERDALKAQVETLTVEVERLKKQ